MDKIRSLSLIDEPLKNGNCEECNHCMQVKRTKYCDATQNKNGKNIPCREMRTCNEFKRIYIVEGQ